MKTLEHAVDNGTQVIEWGGAAIRRFLIECCVSSAQSSK